jgi:hypothetical protein
MESNDTFKSLSSVTQLVLDALLEQQIEKLKFLSAHEQHEAEATQDQPRQAVCVEHQKDSGRNAHSRDEHRQQHRPVLFVINNHQAAPA